MKNTFESKTARLKNNSEEIIEMLRIFYAADFSFLFFRTVFFIFESENILINKKSIRINIFFVNYVSKFLTKNRTARCLGVSFLGRPLIAA